EHGDLSGPDRKNDRVFGAVREGLRGARSGVLGLPSRMRANGKPHTSGDARARFESIGPLAARERMNREWRMGKCAECVAHFTRLSVKSTCTAPWSVGPAMKADSVSPRTV